MYEKIMVCVDGTEMSYKLFEQAIVVAGRYDSDVYLVRIIDMRAIPYMKSYAAMTFDQMTEDAYKKCQEVVASYKAKSDTPERYDRVNIIVEAGSPRKLITPKIAKKINPGLIICGARSPKKGAERFVGNVTMHILNTAKCDVLVVHPDL